MSTDTFPADPDPRLLHTHDPAELIAEARVALGQVPRDCLLLFGHDGEQSSPLVTRSDRSHLLAAGGREHLENHLELMRRRGCRGAFAVIVLGDGYGSVSEQLLAETISKGGTMLLSTAHHMLPEPFEIDHLWVAGDGISRELLLGEETKEAYELWISPPSPLRPYESTRSAAHSVLTGQQTPQEVNADGALAALAGNLRLRRMDPERTDAQTVFAAARTAVARLEAGTRTAASTTYVTDCEHLSQLLSALAVDSLHWELLALCVDRGQQQPVDRDRLLQELTSDASWIPASDVRAGGAWYLALEKCRVVAASVIAGAEAPQRLLAEEAWRGLTVLLALLSWWNHRFATAGGLVDELWTRDPDSTLAPLLSRLTDEPIAPAWWPHD